MAAIPALAIGLACGGGGSPEQPLNRFVAAINDADFNDAYQELSSGCQSEHSLKEFQKTYGAFFLAAGIGGSGLAGGSDLKIEDVKVERIGDYEAEITLDWILHSKLGNPLPVLRAIAEEKVPLNTVLEVAGTADHPLHVFDDSGEGDWRLDDCDPLGVVAIYDQYESYCQEVEAYYGEDLDC